MFCPGSAVESPTSSPFPATGLNKRNPPSEPPSGNLSRFGSARAVISASTASFRERFFHLVFPQANPYSPAPIGHSLPRMNRKNGARRQVDGEIPFGTGAGSLPGERKRSERTGNDQTARQMGAQGRQNARHTEHRGHSPAH